jgi:hypothetical protein
MVDWDAKVEEGAAAIAEISWPVSPTGGPHDYFTGLRLRSAEGWRHQRVLLCAEYLTGQTEGWPPDLLGRREPPAQAGPLLKFGGGPGPFRLRVDNLRIRSIPPEQAGFRPLHFFVSSFDDPAAANAAEGIIWRAADGVNGSPCVEFTHKQTAMSLRYAFRRRDLPLKVSWRSCIRKRHETMVPADRTTWGINLAWQRGASVRLLYKKPPMLNTDQWYENVAYLTEETMDLWFIGQRTTVIGCTPFPENQADHLVFEAHGGMLFDDLSVELIDSKALPPFSAEEKQQITAARKK